MWRELILDVEPSANLHPGASEAELDEVERALDVRLSESLRALLREANGAVGEYGPWYVWSTQQIIEDNRELRERAYTTGYMPLDYLLFFANAGVDGILFALPISAGSRMVGRRVFAWYPIEDGRPCVAESLEDYLMRPFSI